MLSEPPQDVRCGARGGSETNGPDLRPGPGPQAPDRDPQAPARDPEALEAELPGAAGGAGRLTQLGAGGEVSLEAPIE